MRPVLYANKGRRLRATGIRCQVIWCVELAGSCLAYPYVATGMGEMTQPGTTPSRMLEIVDPPKMRIKGTRAACRAVQRRVDSGESALVPYVF